MEPFTPVEFRSKLRSILDDSPCAKGETTLLMAQYQESDRATQVAVSEELRRDLERHERRDQRNTDPE